MAFVRKRGHEGPGGPFASTLSTTLVESYRNAQGRPRQRVLANLHGEKTTLAALAKIAAIRASLREEKSDLDKAWDHLEPIYQDWMQAIGLGHRLTKDDKHKVDKIVKMRKTMQKRAAEIETRLAKLNRDGAAIKKHCTSSDDECQAEIRAYRRRAAEVRSEAAATEFMASEQRKKLRRVLT